MAVRPYKRTKRQAIPRVDLPARRVEVMFDERNNPLATQTTDFTIHNCTVQPSSGWELQTLDIGTKHNEVFSIFTETLVKPAIRGTDDHADEIYLSAPYTAVNGWFKVVQVKPWRNGVIPHYQILVVRTNPN